MTVSFVVRALYGPPRPVLVVAVVGAVAAGDHDEFCRQLRRISHVPAVRVSDDLRRRFGCRELATTMVVDLRETTALTGRALAHLVAECDEDGHRPRIVVGAGDLRDALVGAELYDDLVDAVLRS